MRELTAARLRQLVAYDPISGLFEWRSLRFSAICPGSRAGRLNDRGYVVFKLDQREYRAHRLAWLYVTGSWPVNQIDHINGDRSDNRFSNLRDVDGHVNAQNKRVAASTNRTGLLGVIHRPRNTKRPFVARVQAGDQVLHIGSFVTAAEAHLAYVEVKRRVHEGCTL